MKLTVENMWKTFSTCGKLYVENLLQGYGFRQQFCNTFVTIGHLANNRQN